MGYRRIMGGQSKDNRYRNWANMKRRCYDPSVDSFYLYGGRGIVVCDRWLGRHGFFNFCDDMGEKPVGCSLDRIDPMKGYSPENCRWATPKEQARNRRNNHIVEYKGEKRYLSDLVNESPVKNSTIEMRIYKYGWSLEDALNKPVRKRG